MSAGDQIPEFCVYGTKTVGGTRYEVFSGDWVENILTGWTYSPIRFWDSNASSYEFLGVSGPQTILFENNAPLTAKVTYNPTVSQ